jgi:hypothetical protein
VPIGSALQAYLSHNHTAASGGPAVSEMDAIIFELRLQFVPPGAWPAEQLRGAVEDTLSDVLDDVVLLDGSVHALRVGFSSASDAQESGVADQSQPHTGNGTARSSAKKASSEGGWSIWNTRALRWIPWQWLPWYSRPSTPASDAASTAQLDAPTTARPAKSEASSKQPSRAPATVSEQRTVQVQAVKIREDRDWSFARQPISRTDVDMSASERQSVRALLAESLGITNATSASIVVLLRGVSAADDAAVSVAVKSAAMRAAIARGINARASAGAAEVANVATGAVLRSTVLEVPSQAVRDQALPQGSAEWKAVVASAADEGHVQEPNTVWALSESEDGSLRAPDANITAVKHDNTAAFSREQYAVLASVLAAVAGAMAGVCICLGVDAKRRRASQRARWRAPHGAPRERGSDVGKQPAAQPFASFTRWLSGKVAPAQQPKSRPGSKAGGNAAAKSLQDYDPSWLNDASRSIQNHEMLNGVESVAQAGSALPGAGASFQSFKSGMDVMSMQSSEMPQCAPPCAPRPGRRWLCCMA